MTFFRSYDLHMTATANCAAIHEKLSSFVFSHIMFLKNDDVNARNVQLGQGASGVAFPINSLCTGPM